MFVNDALSFAETIWIMGRCPGLVVMEGDSFSKVASSNPNNIYWMDIFYLPICFKICIVWLKSLKINEKEAGVGPFKKKFY